MRAQAIGNEAQPYAKILGTEGHIWTDGIIGPDYASKIEAQLAQLPQTTTKIVHHIRSGGGDVYGGYKGYIALQKAGLPIKTIIEGEAQSMATFVALAGDEVEVIEPSTVMIHEPYFPDGVSGKIDEMDRSSQELKQIRDEMAARYAVKMGMSIDDAKAMMKKETRFNARGAKTAKFADAVTDPRGAIVAIDENKILNTIENYIMNLFGKRAVANAAAKDFPVKSGGALSVPGDSIAQGMQATFNGAPAEGSYTLADGTVVMCTAGIVQTITPPTQQQPNETAQLQQQIGALQSQLSALQAKEAEKIKAEEAAKIKAEEEAKAKTAAEEAAKKAEVEKVAAEETKRALAAAEAKIKELETKTLGNSAPAAQANVGSRYPGRAPQAADVEATKLFLYQNGFAYLADNPNSPMYGYRPSPNALSILETNFSYTWPGILTTDIIYKPTLQAPAIADIVTVDQGIKDRKQYNLVTQLDKILKPYGGCTRVFNNNRQLITNVPVQTKEFQIAESWCKDDFTGQLTGIYNNLASEWLKTGNRSFDPTGTPIASIIDKLLQDALQRDVFRRFSFAAGNSSDDDYNQFDGLWDRLIDSSGNSNYCVIRANSSVFGGTPLGIADVLAPGVALTTLESMYIRSKQILKNMPNKTFWVTRSIWDNYYNSLISGVVTGATEASFKNLQDGLTNLTYKGIPVKPVDLWDAFLQESDNPLFGITKHLALLTVKENHMFGVENGADLNKIEGWYERKDRKFYYEGDMKMGYNYFHCDLATIAY